jgi:hypothetical protein
LADLGGNLESDELLVRTVIAIFVMTTMFPGDERLWRRARGKAIRFIARAVGKGVPDVEQWFANLRAKLVAP